MTYQTLTRAAPRTKGEKEETSTSEDSPELSSHGDRPRVRKVSIEKIKKVAIILDFSDDK